MRLLFSCGGSGGHINPAVAIAVEMKELFPDAQILFVGGKGKMEEELIPKAGFEFTGLSVDNLRRSISPRNLAHNVKSAYLAVSATIEARKIVRGFKPDAAIGTGGYACYPALKAAARLGVPVLLHESNVLPGLATKMLEKSAAEMLLGFEDSLKYMRFPNKATVTGTPVRAEFRIASGRRSDADTKTVLSFWGSLGSKYLNERVPQLVEIIERSRSFRYVHAAGKNSSLPERNTLYTEVKRYIYDMPSAMSGASLVICRSGAGTLNELAAAGKPAILIPSPFVTGNHQYPNAKTFADAGAAVLIEEKDASAERLFKTAAELLSDRTRLASMSAAARALDNPGAAGRIAERIIEAINAKRGAGSMYSRE
ncbi:MAG: undecaprenyldiphospho-muramoylpentapeptide beta-N-acetylglucosaminyltransferase [Oscillospiraceae bacterium]|jgi:UDP-N-acetylglucosamine--N-acetylmuramyl-(pentapeptide) pyrophosphoryl-undecaprenol N-acetylglucosamine transferase|nr:undecaprenyldiphospho-muramoylpentapeptide beta-N-acetylglucosaminyltransferase [Oscillospiraceae bacterium]